MHRLQFQSFGQEYGVDCWVFIEMASWDIWIFRRHYVMTNDSFAKLRGFLLSCQYVFDFKSILEGRLWR